VPVRQAGNGLDAGGDPEGGLRTLCRKMHFNKEMTFDELPYPSLLGDLIAESTWTGMKDLGKVAARRVSPDDDQLVLMIPPFHTIAIEIARGNSWWRDGLTNVGEIVYENALIIADFGPGSDSPVILYYEQMGEPVVMYLKWSVADGKVSHSWCQSHRSFDDFARDGGLVAGENHQSRERESCDRLKGRLLARRDSTIATALHLSPGIPSYRNSTG